MSEDPEVEEQSVEPNPAALYSRYQTATAIVRCVQSMIPALDTCPDVFAEYWDTVNASGAFEDSELVAMGITAAQLGALVTVVESYNKFMVNDNPPPSNYKTSLNLARRLSA